MMDTAMPPLHQQPAKEFICPCCNIRHATSVAMIEHIQQSPIVVKTFTCSVCSLEFFLKSDLIDHQRLDHRMPVSKKYKCDECDVDYSNAVQLQRHKWMHDEIARKLAQSGIFLPRANKPTLADIKEEPASEGDCVVDDDVCDSDNQKDSKDNICSFKMKTCAVKNLKSEQSNHYKKDDSDPIHEQKIKMKLKILESVRINSIPVQDEDQDMAQGKQLDEIQGKTLKRENFKRLKLIGRDARTRSCTEDCGHDVFHQRNSKRLRHVENTQTKSDDTDSGVNSLYRTKSQRLTRHIDNTRARSEAEVNDHVFQHKKTHRLKQTKNIQARPGTEEFPNATKCDSSGTDIAEDGYDPVQNSQPIKRKNVKRTRTLAIVNLCEDSETVERKRNKLVVNDQVDLDTDVKTVVEEKKNGKTNRRGKKTSIRFSFSRRNGPRKAANVKVKECEGGEDEVPPHVVQEDGTIQCPDCLLMCLSLNGLNRHRKNHFKTMKTLKCVFCEVIFDSKDSMNKHMTSTHPLRKFSNAFMSRPNVPQFPCPEEGCDASFKGKSTLTKHRVAVHGLDRYRENACTKCGKQLSNQAELSVHMRMHTGHKPFKCDLCPKAFKTSSNLVLHRKTHSEKKPFTCEDCGRGFNYVNSLRRHIRCAHTGERPYMCDACGLTFPCHGTLSQHARSYGHGKLSLPGQFSCQQCGKRFRTESGVRNHMQGDREGRCKGMMLKEPMICELCGRECSSKLTLKLHRMTHSSERPFKCRLCDATFRQHAARSNHEKVHGGKKDYECTMCEKTFFYRAALRGHMRRHLNNACSVCGKTCGSPSELARHQKCHDKQMAKGLKCPYCPASFRVMHRLTGHMIKQHPGLNGVEVPRSSQSPQFGESYPIQRTDDYPVRRSDVTSVLTVIVPGSQSTQFEESCSVQRTDMNTVSPVKALGISVSPV